MTVEAISTIFLFDQFWDIFARNQLFLKRKKKENKYNNFLCTKKLHAIIKLNENTLE